MWFKNKRWKNIFFSTCNIRTYKALSNQTRTFVMLEWFLWWITTSQCASSSISVDQVVFRRFVQVSSVRVEKSVFLSAISEHFISQRIEFAYLIDKEKTKIPQYWVFAFYKSSPEFFICIYLDSFKISCFESEQVNTSTVDVVTCLTN